MQRQIKFRGKRTDNGEWVTGWYLEAINYLSGETKPQIGWIRQAPSAIDRNIPAFEPIAYDVDPATVGQYTGLKDCNGQEIFEGDHLACTHWFFDGTEIDEYFEATVGFSDGSFVLEGICSPFYQNNTGENKGQGKCWFGEINFYESDYEVVGNIHDNPELLKEAAHE
jgi:uncharacterized phage protein (TIGR01671 family)